jgi:putative DNA primase/helicase
MELAPMENGILHIPTRRILPATPRLYTHHSFGFSYDDAAAGTPRAWLSFLDTLWPGDPGSVQVLQEIMGYLLLPDTSQQKAFLLVGPKRSGKGTIGRIITAMLGQHNVCAPTLGSMAGQFGLQPMIGKLLALVSDARLSAKSDQAAIAERILTVSGEDAVTIDRKHLPPWSGRLSTRFMVLTNELPRLADTSGALASRFIVLTLEKSFFGKEDPSLTQRLLGELPDIFGWALDGWERLAERGHFVQPASAEDAIQELEDLGSPISAFIRERCRVTPGATVEVKRIYSAWKNWCEAEGRDHPGTAQTFGRDLRAAVPGLKNTQPWVGDNRVRRYEGIGLT